MKARPKSGSKRRLVRGDRVVEQTLGAALEELGRVGYAALRVEDVAARARVNKTTVYRRWPTKEALVKAALTSTLGTEVARDIPDTGSVREDLLAHVRDVLPISSSPAGRTIVRLLAAEQPDPEVLAIARSMQSSHKVVTLALLKRAQERGELRADLDPKLFLEVLGAAFDHLVMEGQFAEISETKVQAVAEIIDLLLTGALSDGPRRRPRVPRPRTRRTHLP
jgi:AcrR family transcriptional regulator